MEGKVAAALFVAALAGVGGGVALDRTVLGPSSAETREGPKVLYWVAPMDPNYRRDGPGKSPMGMDLVPAYEGQEPGMAEAKADPTEVALSPGEIQAIGVRTAVAREEPLETRIETVGFVSYDERRSSDIRVRAAGWIEALNVPASSEQVHKGDRLFEIYSPEITIAFWEHLRALKTGKKSAIAAAARKLRNFGVSEAQITETGDYETARRLKVFAPQDGVVVNLHAVNGMYVKPETQTMTITDLSGVWLLADVFEQVVIALPGGRVRPRLVTTDREERGRIQIVQGLSGWWRRPSS
jgi:Cu(I)/Ag(I) efflux system membrane fusion protein